MRTKSRSGFKTFLIASAVGALLCGGVAPSWAQDRLLGMVEPVKAKKPYRIAFAGPLMNSDFWLGITYGFIEESNGTRTGSLPHPDWKLAARNGSGSLSTRKLSAPPA